MNHWLEAAGLASLWVVAILRAPAVARYRRQRPLWLCVCLIAVTTTLYQEPIIRTLGGLIGDLNLIDLSRYVCHTIAATVMLYFVFVAVGRQRHTRLLVSAGAVMVAGTIWLNVTAPPHARSTITTPELPLAYWLFCFGFYLVVNVIAVTVCWRYAQQAGSKGLCWSLWVFGLSRLFGFLRNILFSAYLLTHISVLLSYVPTVTGIELLLLAASVLLPGIASAQQNLTQRRTLWTLWPLWQSLTGTIPNIILPGSGSRLGTLFTSLDSVNWRLYRLVIEIRDASLILRAYVTPATVAAAQQFAAARQVPRADLDAAAAACWLETARQAKLAGTSPRSTVSDITGPGGKSLREEIEFLLGVARFHAGPLPAEFAAHHLAEAHR